MSGLLAQTVRERARDVAWLAIWPPARRASRVDPLLAPRHS